jgi:ribose transport system substrate-binding protein
MRIGLGRSSAALLMAALALAACTSTSGSVAATPSQSKAGMQPPPGDYAESGEVLETVGPNGETGVPLTSITFTPDELKKIRDGGFTSALLLQTSSTWADAVTRGAQETFKELGIKVIAENSSKNFNAAQQANAVKTVLAQKPDGIVTWPINPQELVPSLTMANEAGVKLAFISNLPDGFEKGKDYVSVTGDDLFGMGKVVADQMAKAINEEGDIGFIYFNANAYVVNVRDAAARTVLERDYPKMKIVAMQGLSDPLKSREAASRMLLQHPNLKAIFVSFAEFAPGAQQAVMASKNKDVVIATMDLSNTVGLSMASDGPIKAVAIDEPYGLGRGAALSIGAALIGKDVPGYLQVKALPVTKENLVESYREYYKSEPPKEIVEALR